MKTTKFLVLFLLFLNAYQSNVFGQFRVSTNNPYVENFYSSNLSDLPITRVAIHETRTYVYFEYKTSPNLKNGWISINSNTTLTAKNSDIALKIEGWSDDTKIKRSKILKLGTRYPVKANRKYEFALAFPSIPLGVDVISIRANIGAPNEFYWENIHIYNHPDKSSSPTNSSLTVYGTTIGDAILYDSNWERITTIAKDNSVEIISKEREWHKVKFRHLEGYIHEGMLKFE